MMSVDVSSFSESKKLKFNLFKTYPVLKLKQEVYLWN